jgi:hypothetical protein
MCKVNYEIIFLRINHNLSRYLIPLSMSDYNDRFNFGNACSLKLLLIVEQEIIFQGMRINI